MTILEFSVERCAGVDSASALIYMWEITDAISGALVGRYIGKASKGEDRPLKHYSRNVRNLLSGRPYRKDNPDGFRRIHHALARAVTEGNRVKLVLLVNCGTSEDINSLEREFIRRFDCSGQLAWQLND